MIYVSPGLYIFYGFSSGSLTTQYFISLLDFINWGASVSGTRTLLVIFPGRGFGSHLWVIILVVLPVWIVQPTTTSKYGVKASVLRDRP